MQRPPREKDPVQAQLEAALEAAENLDLEALERRSREKAPRPGGGRPRRDEFEPTEGVVVGTDGSDVIVELGPRMQGVADLGEFDEPPRVGERFRFTLHGQKDGLWILSRRRVRALAAWDNLTPGARIEARVIGVNSGGLDVQVGPLTGFLPASQASDRHVDDLSTLIGQSFVCQVTEVDSGRKRLVLSRRKVLEQEREEARREVTGRLEPGSRVRGRVTRIEPFGAFVDLGGIEGLAHVSNLSHRRIGHPDEVLKVGDEIEALVLNIEEGGRRIGLGLKQIQRDPWEDAAERFAPEQLVRGRVARLEPFGAFVELVPGVEGLLHISQMGFGGDRTRRVSDALSVDQEIEVRITAIDRAKKRISLTRLDSRGAVIGSEDAAELAEIDQVLRRPETPPAATNLGNLFKKALDQKAKPEA